MIPLKICTYFLLSTQYLCLFLENQNTHASNSSLLLKRFHSKLFFFVINSTILIIYSKTEASFFLSALFSRFASHSMECELADNFHCCCAWLENGLLIHIHVCVLDCVVCLIFFCLLLQTFWYSLVQLGKGQFQFRPHLFVITFTEK